MRGDEVQGRGPSPAGPPPGQQPRAARIAGAQGDVLGDRHPLDQPQVLMDEGHGAGGRFGAERVTGDGHLALVRVVDAREHLDEGGLPGTVGTEQGEDAAGVDVEVDRVQREGAAEPFAEAAYADERLCGTARGRSALSGASCTDFSGVGLAGASRRRSAGRFAGGAARGTSGPDRSSYGRFGLCRNRQTGMASNSPRRRRRRGPSAHSAQMTLPRRCSGCPRPGRVGRRGTGRGRPRRWWPHGADAGRCCWCRRPRRSGCGRGAGVPGWARCRSGWRW